MPWEGNAHTPLELRVFIVGYEGSLRAHFPDDRYRLHRRNELILFFTIPGNGIDLERTAAGVFVIGRLVVSIVVAIPGLLGVLLYLNDDIGIVEPIDLDLLP